MLKVQNMPQEQKRTSQDSAESTEECLRSLAAISAIKKRVVEILGDGSDVIAEQFETDHQLQKLEKFVQENLGVDEHTLYSEAIKIVYSLGDFEGLGELGDDASPYSEETEPTSNSQELEKHEIQQRALKILGDRFLYLTEQITTRYQIEKFEKFAQNHQHYSQEQLSVIATNIIFEDEYGEAQSSALQSPDAPSSSFENGVSMFPVV